MERKGHNRQQSKVTKRDSSLIRQILNIPTDKTLKKSATVGKLLTFPQITIDTMHVKLSKIHLKNKQFWPNQILPLQFEKYHKEHKKPLYSTCYRYFIHESHLAFIDSLKSIIIIQTIYRSFYSRKTFYTKTKDFLKAKGINAILSIQARMRQYLQLKHFKAKLLINAILSIRQNHFKTVENQITKFYYKNKENKLMIYRDIIRIRTKSIKMIQKTYRQSVIYRQVKAIQERMKINYFFMYPFYAETISLKLYSFGDDSSQFKLQISIFNYEYCSLFRCFCLFVPHELINSGKYRCQFIVDEIPICDGRYPHIEFSDGLFYNLIDFKKNNLPALDDLIESADLDETRAEDLNKIDPDNFSDKCFLDGIKNIKADDDYLSLRIDLYGKKPVPKMAMIRRESLSKIELTFQ